MVPWAVLGAAVIGAVVWFVMAAEPTRIAHFGFASIAVTPEVTYDQLIEAAEGRAPALAPVIAAEVCLAATRTPAVEWLNNVSYLAAGFAEIEPPHIEITEHKRGWPSTWYTKTTKVWYKDPIAKTGERPFITNSQRVIVFGNDRTLINRHEDWRRFGTGWSRQRPPESSGGRAIDEWFTPTAATFPLVAGLLTWAAVRSVVAIARGVFRRRSARRSHWVTALAPAMAVLAFAGSVAATLAMSTTSTGIEPAFVRAYPLTHDALIPGHTRASLLALAEDPANTQEICRLLVDAVRNSRVPLPQGVDRLALRPVNNLHAPDLAMNSQPAEWATPASFKCIVVSPRIYTPDIVLAPWSPSSVADKPRWDFDYPRLAFRIVDSLDPTRANEVTIDLEATGAVLAAVVLIFLAARAVVTLILLMLARRRRRRHLCVACAYPLPASA